MARGGRTMAAFMVIGMIADAAVAAAPPAPVAASSKWQMDYAPSECRLIRTFGEGRDRATLQLARLDVADVMEMALAGSRIPATDGDVAVSVATTTVAQVPGMHARGYSPAGDAPGTLRFRPDKDLPGALRGDAAAGQPTRLGIRFVRGYAVALDLGSMKGPLAALDNCMDNLVASWGLNPAEQRQRRSAPEPVGNPAEWFRSDDYPEAQGRKGVGGLVVIRLMVGADGGVGDCAVSKAGGDKAFEEATCRALTARARFRPAIGAGGQPIPSVWIKRVNWMPGAPFVTAA